MRQPLGLLRSAPPSFVIWASIGLGAVLSACGDDAQPPPIPAPAAASTTTLPSATAATPAVEIPSPEELATYLLTTDETAGGWSIASDLESWGMAPGVVTDEMRVQLPSLDVCPEAGEEAAAAAASVAWQAFTAMEMPGEENPIMLGEFLYAADPIEVQAVFEALRDGTLLCAESGGDESEAAEVIALPDLGDDRFGVRVATTEGGVRFYLWGAFVRDGSVFVFVDLWEATSGVPLTTSAQFTALVAAAVGQLP